MRRRRASRLGAIATRHRKVERRQTEAPRRAVPSEPGGRRPRRRVHTVAKVTLVTILVGASLGAIGQWVLHTSYLRVQHVNLVGVRHERAAMVLAASGLQAHPTMFGVSASSIERSLRRFPWIVGVSIEKHWPSTLVVTVHETTPVAVAFDAHHLLQFVDQGGRDLGPAPLGTNLPTLQFLRPTSAAWPYRRAGSAAAYVASQLPIAFGAQVSVITEDANGQVALKMTTPVTFVLGTATQLHAKFVAIASVIAHTTLRPGDVVDATVPDELAVTGPPPS